MKRFVRNMRETLGDWFCAVVLGLFLFNAVTGFIPSGDIATLGTMGLLLAVGLMFGAGHAHSRLHKKLYVHQMVEIYAGASIFLATSDLAQGHPARDSAEEAVEFSATELRKLGMTPPPLPTHIVVGVVGDPPPEG